VSIDQSPDDAVVTGLFSYPIKSCAGVSLSTARLLRSGLLHDREWMLVNARHSPARFITQREQPILATVAVAYDASGALSITGDGSTNALQVDRPQSTANLRRVKVWSSEVFGLDAGDEAAQWFAALLSESAHHIRLVCFHREHQRACNTLYAGESGAHTFFADGYPVLVTNQASLDDLNRRMDRSADHAMPMNRFRPNIVLHGLAAWDEDHIDIISVGVATLRLVKPCVRCEITTTDQSSGARRSDKPLNTLGRFRNNPDYGGVTFGWNAVVLAESEAIRVGDRIEVEYRF
jgi:uncharacterized protein